MQLDCHANRESEYCHCDEKVEAEQLAALQIHGQSPGDILTVSLKNHTQALPASAPVHWAEKAPDTAQRDSADAGETSAAARTHVLGGFPVVLTEYEGICWAPAKMQGIVT